MTIPGIVRALEQADSFREALAARSADADFSAVTGVERGGTSAQRTVFGTLDDLVAQAPGWSNGGPTLVLVGAAVDRAIPAQARPLPVPA